MGGELTLLNLPDHFTVELLVWQILVNRYVYRIQLPFFLCIGNCTDQSEPQVKHIKTSFYCTLTLDGWALNRLEVAGAGELRTGVDTRSQYTPSKVSSADTQTNTIDPFLGIFVATVFILEVKLKWPVRQFQASLTKLSALLQVVVQFRYNRHTALGIQPPVIALHSIPMPERNAHSWA